VLEVKINKIDEYDHIEITNDRKKFTIHFGGNLDLYWSFYDYDEEYAKKKITFEITKEDYILWELFNELYNDIRNCNIFKVDDLEISFCNTKEELKELFESNMEINERIKNSEVYKDIYDGKQIKWYSDEETENLVTISKEIDKYILEYTPGKKITYLDDYSIRFRNSGSRYSPFNIVFMEMYNKLKSGNYDFNQVHIEEYIYRQKKLTKSK